MVSLFLAAESFFYSLTGGEAGPPHPHRSRTEALPRVKSFDETGQVILSTVVRHAAERMEDLADIINVAIEELIRESFELPGFSTLHKEATAGRRSTVLSTAALRMR
jgi:hypothetical protein